MENKLNNMIIGDILNKDKQSNKYKYSVVTPAYNVEDYIEETVSSVFTQTWLTDNPGKIQMVVVNDGSTDKTLSKLEELAEKYEDLLVINKSNSGVSDTRNLGANFATGEYINFLDSDDKLSDNVFEEATRVFSENKDLMLFKMNRKFFEKRTGFVEYYMRDLKTSQVIDVTKQSYYPIIHVASLIFHHSLWEEEMFPSEVIYGEDAWVAGIMLEKSPKVYYSFEATYCYRKRFFETSLVDQHKGDTRKYLGQLENYYMPYLDLIKSRFGKISDHIQNTILYSLSWNLKNKEDYDVLTKEYVEHYVFRIHEMLQDFDDDNIMKQRRLMNYYLRHSLLVIKETGKLPYKSHFYPTTTSEIDGEVIPVVNNFSGKRVESFKNLPFRVTIIKSINGDISLLGRFNTIFDLKNKDNFKFYARNSKGEIFNFDEEISVKLKSYYFMNVELKRMVGYSSNIPGEFFSNSEYVEFIASILVDGVWYETPCELDFIGHFSWLVNRYPSSYFIHGDKLISYDNKKLSLVVEDNTNKLIRKKEKEFKRSYKKVSKEKNVLFWRKFSNYLRAYKNKKALKVNMYMDRDSGIWDNGTALILKHNEILKETGNKKEKNYFIVSKESAGYAELKKMGVKVIPFKSFRHKMLMVSADRLISSQANLANYNPFRFEWNNKLNDKQCFEFFYLQHGVSLRKTASVEKPWMNRTGLGIDHIIAGNQLEYDYLSGTNNGTEFIKESVFLVGQARHDYLEIKEQALDANKEKQILVMPTWRKDLTRWSGGKYVYNPNYKFSDHFEVWNSFLNSDKLYKILKENNTKLIFAPHPLEQIQLEDYDLKYVDKVIDKVTDYNKLINSMDAFITDFSSLGMDFFYAKKPIFILDTGDDNWENFDEKISYQNGTFGSVTTDADSLIEKIECVVQNNFEVSEDLLKTREWFYENELVDNISEKILKEFGIIK